MSHKFPHQLVNEFAPHLSDTENILALGIFRKEASIPQLIFTKGLVRFFLPEFHAALTDHGLLVIPVRMVKGEKILADPIKIAYNEISLTRNLFAEPVVRIRSNALDTPLKLRFRYGMQSLGLRKTDFIHVLKTHISAY
ncbi:hypothetical protein KQH62_02610 [bacterium]|nr:hypothetical protein [bacterium]